MDRDKEMIMLIIDDKKDNSTDNYVRYKRDRVSDPAFRVPSGRVSDCLPRQ